MRFSLPLTALLLPWLHAQDPEIARLQANGWAYDGQGSALACDGRSLLVGAPFGRSYSIDGSATLYERDAGERSGWREVQRIEAPGYGTIDRFGHALDIDGDILAVGAWREDQAQGAVHVFERRGSGAPFEPIARLEPTHLGPGQRFGYSLDLDGTRLLVGAPRGALPPDYGWEGRAYLFERDASGAWQLAAELAHPDPSSSEPQFGYTLALQDDLALLGTYYLGFGVAFQVHVFVRVGGTWVHRQIPCRRSTSAASARRASSESRSPCRATSSTSRIPIATPSTCSTAHRPGPASSRGPLRFPPTRASP